jgi:hypothetical protein
MRIFVRELTEVSKQQECAIGRSWLNVTQTMSKSFFLAHRVILWMA